MYKVRFHLGAGEHYKHWQVKDDSNGEVKYFDPSCTSLHLQNCVLKNNRKTAERIFLGDNKTVCAWVLCENYSIVNENIPSWYSELKYNPKIRPYWHFEIGVECLDNMIFYNIFSKENKLFVGRREEGYLIHS